LEALNDSGLLDAAIAALEQRESLLRIVVDQAARPGSVAAIKNTVTLAQTLSHIDPDALAGVGEGVAVGVNRLQQGGAVKVTGIWDVLKAARDPDISRALSAILTVLKTVGEHLREQGGE
jgi:uncharacterized protein YjgD (DUF1641 family)